MNLRKDHYRERRTHAQASSSSYSGKRVPLSFSSRVGASARSAVSASDAVSPRPGSAKHSPRGWWCARVARKGRVLNVVTRGTGHLARLASFLARRGERNAASAARRRRAQRFKELRAVAVLPTWPGAAPFRLVFSTSQPFVTYRQGGVACAASLRRHSATRISSESSKFTLCGGSLGSCVDEERSQLRELM